MTLSRRTLLLGAAAGCGIGQAAAKNIGVQLYTVRDVIGKQSEETLGAIAKIGYTEVEVIRATLPKIGPILKQLGLKPVSAHLDTAMFTGKGAPPNMPTLEAALDEVKAAGVQFAVCPYVAPADRGKTLDDYKKFADQLNKAAEKTHAAGLKLCYHNHAFEFEPMEGSRPIDVILKNTDKKLMALELDVFWVGIAGEDPVEWIKAQKGRVDLLHLKDKATDAPKQFNERVPRTAFKEVGNGTLNFPSILKAARASGAKHFFVEQDQTPGDPLDSLRQSYANLSKIW